jgi:hypothetical protein
MSEQINFKICKISIPTENDFVSKENRVTEGSTLDKSGINVDRVAPFRFSIKFDYLSKKKKKGVKIDHLDPNCASTTQCNINALIANNVKSVTFKLKQVDRLWT